MRHQLPHEYGVHDGVVEPGPRRLRQPQLPDQVVQAVAPDVLADLARQSHAVAESMDQRFVVMARSEMNNKGQGSFRLRDLIVLCRTHPTLQFEPLFGQFLMCYIDSFS